MPQMILLMLMLTLMMMLISMMMLMFTLMLKMLLTLMMMLMLRGRAVECLVSQPAGLERQTGRVDRDWAVHYFYNQPPTPNCNPSLLNNFFTMFSSLPTVLTFFAESCKADSNLIDPKTKVLLLIWILPPSPNPSDALYSYLGCNGPPTARGRQIGNHRSPSLICWNHHPFPPEEGL